MKNIRNRNQPVNADLVQVYLQSSWDIVTAVYAALDDLQTLKDTFEAGLYSKSINIQPISGPMEVTLFYAQQAITLTRIRTVLRGSVPSLDWTLRFATDRSAVGTEAVIGGSTTTNINEGDEITVFNNAAIPAGSHVWLEVTGLSGTIDAAAFTVFYS